MTRAERARLSAIYRAEHPEWVKATTARYYARHVERIVAAKAGGCIDCGYDEDRARLHFHHRDPGTKRYTVARMSTSSDATFAAEVAKCDVLCDECHRRRHA